MAEPREHITSTTLGGSGRGFAILGTLAFLLLAPGTIVGLVPWLISRWHMQAPLLGFAPFRPIGVLLIAAGIPVVLESFARFALKGIGTPAPIFPTQHLVVSGIYRYVRNPMYVAVVAVILGQGLLLGNMVLLVYAGCGWLATHIFVLSYEEPTLSKTFGAEYDLFCANVPRWLPRITPWNGDPAPHSSSSR